VPILKDSSIVSFPFLSSVDSYLMSTESNCGSFMNVLPSNAVTFVRKTVILCVKTENYRTWNNDGGWV
jgi:hypothetical protein